MQRFETTLRGRVTREDKARSDYALVPFELPFAARSLHVSYAYSAPMSSDQVEGGNVIDLGLFDPRGSDFPGGAGFRGWSGSARSEFKIGEDEATPGYLPGPLPPGRYQVILGLYRIWEAGADYAIEITAEPAAEGQAEVEPGTVMPVAGDIGDVADESSIQAQSSQMRGRYRPPGGAEPAVWLKGDLQSHTFYSDAKGSPEQLVAKAHALELDFLAITDHNTVSHHAVLPQLASGDLLLIPGQEVTTYYGHMNVWGTSEWCDFRAAAAEEMAEIIERAHVLGGVCSINHPKEGGPPWEFGFDFDVQSMEVWQGPWPNRNTESLALWDRLLSEGHRMPAVGGSDYHCPAGEESGLSRLGQPTTWVHAPERSVEGILAAITAGRACISAHAWGPRMDLSATSGENEVVMGGILHTGGEEITLTVDVHDAEGYRLRTVADGLTVEETPVESHRQRMRLRVPARTYLRCEVVGDMKEEDLPPGAPNDLDLTDWRWALSNPVYVRNS